MPVISKMEVEQDKWGLGGEEGRGGEASCRPGRGLQGQPGARLLTSVASSPKV